MFYYDSDNDPIKEVLESKYEGYRVVEMHATLENGGTILVHNIPKNIAEEVAEALRNAEPVDIAEAFK